MPGRDIRISGGTHRGVSRNFLTLLREADPRSDYVAFCDQDDVWDPEKLARAVDRLEEMPRGVPALYCGRRVVTDAQLTPLGLSQAVPRPPCFRNALVENIASSITLIANRAALDILRAAAEAHAGMVSFHDWWAYQVVSGVGGSVVHDPRPMVFHRRHDAALSASTRYATGDRRHAIKQNIAALSAISPLLTPGNRALVNAFADFREATLTARLTGLRKARLHRQTRTGQAALWAAAITGSF